MNRRLANAAAALFLTGLSTLGADQRIQSVQQTLKDQGFYYGAVNGEKNADTSAAIRRYQIRKGLKITGDLDPETLKSLDTSIKTASSASHVPAPTPRSAVTSDRPPLPALSSPSASLAGPSSDSQSAFITPRYPNGPAAPPAGTGGVFAGTPYEYAPIESQMRVVAQTQQLLLRSGYYRGRIDGIYGPGTAMAVRSFQSNAGILPSGQLDTGTLTALGLAPSQDLQSMNEAQGNDAEGWRDDAFKMENGKWKIKKHHHHRRLFLILP